MTQSAVHSDSAFHVRFTKGYELIQKHPEYVPVMFLTSKDVNLEKDTIMSPRNATLCNVIMQFRKNLNVDDTSRTTGFIFYIKTEDGKVIMPKLTETVGELHDRYHRSDMWLTVKIDKEEIFG